jgi:hypothetical protein
MVFQDRDTLADAGIAYMSGCPRDKTIHGCGGTPAERAPQLRPEQASKPPGRRGGPQVDHIHPPLSTIRAGKGKTAA